MLSSRIEGIRATLSDLYRDELGDDAARYLGADVREVRNYVDALEHGMSRLKDLPISLRLVREMHAILLRGVRGEQMMPGEFRSWRRIYAASPILHILSAEGGEDSHI